MDLGRQVDFAAAACCHSVLNMGVGGYVEKRDNYTVVCFGISDATIIVFIRWMR